MKKRLLSFFLLLFLGILCLNINSSHAFIVTMSVSHSPDVVTANDIVVVESIISFSSPLTAALVCVEKDGQVKFISMSIEPFDTITQICRATIGRFTESTYVVYTVTVTDAYNVVRTKQGSFTVESTSTTTTSTTGPTEPTEPTSTTTTDSSTTSDTHSPEYTPPPSNLDSNTIASGLGTTAIILLITTSAIIIIRRRKNR